MADNDGWTVFDVSKNMAAQRAVKEFATDNLIEVFKLGMTQSEKTDKDMKALRESMETADDHGKINILEGINKLYDIEAAVNKTAKEYVDKAKNQSARESARLTNLELNFALLDTNGDGKISSAEIKQGAIFDSSGFISIDRLKNTPLGVADRAELNAKITDRDNDGKVTSSEIGGLDKIMHGRENGEAIFKIANDMQGKFIPSEAIVRLTDITYKNIKPHMVTDKATTAELDHDRELIEAADKVFLSGLKELAKHALPLPPVVPSVEKDKPKAKDGGVTLA